MSTAIEIHEAAQRLERKILGTPTGPLQRAVPTGMSALPVPGMPAGMPALPVLPVSRMFWEGYKLLVIADSPTQNTGFAAVTKALLPRWTPHFDRIDVWGINYGGWPHKLPWKIFPGGIDWTTPARQELMLNHILNGDYTHVWILQDAFVFSRDGFAQNVRMACEKAGAKLVVYYPVDAPVEKSWLGIARLADAAVTYTQYGAEETRKADPELNPAIIPHGVDTAVFRPLFDSHSLTERDKLRERIYGNWAAADDFVMVNVNRNERRKGLPGSLQVLAAVRKLGVPAKLFLHMPQQNPMEKTDLKLIGTQLGLEFGEHWVCTSEELFGGGVGNMTSEQVNLLYNASDLLLTTTLGEGWGFSISESAAAGLPVVCPDHTSCGEIGRMFDTLGRCQQIRLAPLSATAVVNSNDNSRVRYPVDVVKTADIICEIAEESKSKSKSKSKSNSGEQGAGKFPPLEGELKEWLSWDRIAEAWLEVFQAVARGKAESGKQKVEISKSI